MKLMPKNNLAPLLKEVGEEFADNCQAIDKHDTYYLKRIVCSCVGRYQGTWFLEWVAENFEILIEDAGDVAHLVDSNDNEKEFHVEGIESLLRMVNEYVENYLPESVVLIWDEEGINFASVGVENDG